MSAVICCVLQCSAKLVAKLTTTRYSSRYLYIIIVDSTAELVRLHKHESIRSNHDATGMQVYVILLYFILTAFRLNNVRLECSLKSRVIGNNINLTFINKHGYYQQRV